MSQFQRPRVKLQRIAYVYFPVIPIMTAWEFAVFVGDFLLLQCRVECAVIFDQEIILAAID